MLDIFINEAGWEMDKYSAVMGGIVIAFLMAGQLIGGFLGDRFGVREVAMIGFTLGLWLMRGLPRCRDIGRIQLSWLPTSALEQLSMDWLGSQLYPYLCASPIVKLGAPNLQHTCRCSIFLG